MSRAVAIIMVLALGLPGLPRAQEQRPVVVASKTFNESYILCEIMAQLLEARGFEVERRSGLGGTLVCYEALRQHSIDVYPEYSGTLAQAILKVTEPLDYVDIQRVLSERENLLLLASFGFNNTYAIAVPAVVAAQYELKTVGDLARVSGLSYGFSHEFLNRQDGWLGLARTYDLSATPRGIEHGLAYEAISEGKIDVTDVYSTDGDIGKYNLTLLADDHGYFPVYLAAPLVHDGVPPAVNQALGELAGRISAVDMQAMNARVLLDGTAFDIVARDFLTNAGLTRPGEGPASSGMWSRLAHRTLTHLKLTFIALLGAILLALPLGIYAYRHDRIAKPLLYFAGILQTIPSIALLAFMIPLFGIGALPAIMALFLYAILPILRNTVAGLFSVDPVLKRVSTGMGLTAAQRLRYVELPLAMPTILAGVRTAAVISIGTATLAAFIGAGGLGEPIVTGLALNDTRLVMEGAIPAALLAILAEFGFEALERAVVPKHLA